MVSCERCGAVWPAGAFGWVQALLEESEEVVRVCPSCTEGLTLTLPVQLNRLAWSDTHKNTMDATAIERRAMNNHKKLLKKPQRVRNIDPTFRTSNFHDRRLFAAKFSEWSRKKIMAFRAQEVREFFAR